MKDKKCTICLNFFPETEEYFYKRNNGKGLSPYCKECYKKKSSKWTKENPEKRKKIHAKDNSKPQNVKKVREWSKINRLNGNQKKWQQENKDSLAEYRKKRISKKHEFSEEDWNNCKEYFGFSCAYCGISYSENLREYKQDFHKDHIDSNGSNNIDNCVPSCKSCNSKKWKFSFVDWYNKNNEIFSVSRYNRIIKWMKKPR